MEHACRGVQTGEYCTNIEENGWRKLAIAMVKQMRLHTCRASALNNYEKLLECNNPEEKRGVVIT